LTARRNPRVRHAISGSVACSFRDPGDTADAVTRRSLVPCVFVPGLGSLPHDVLVAIDGSARAMPVLTTAKDFARQIGANLRVVTVEPERPPEWPHLAAAIPAARTLDVSTRVRAAQGRALEVRQGNPAEQIVPTLDERQPDVLAIGRHRGGPPGSIDAGSTARRLAHEASCAIPTVLL
jgi:nucleotide-binding universal stress UspA family protein